MPLTAEQKREKRKQEAEDKAAASAVAGVVPRPEGRAPKDHTWDEHRGVWVGPDGKDRKEATRNQRRVAQRNASDDQRARHAEYNTWYTHNYQSQFPWLCRVGAPPPPEMVAPQGELKKQGALRFSVTLHSH